MAQHRTDRRILSNECRSRLFSVRRPPTNRWHKNVLINQRIKTGRRIIYSRGIGSKDKYLTLLMKLEGIINPSSLLFLWSIFMGRFGAISASPWRVRVKGPITKSGCYGRHTGRSGWMCHYTSVLLFHMNPVYILFLGCTEKLHNSSQTKSAKLRCACPGTVWFGLPQGPPTAAAKRTEPMSNQEEPRQLVRILRTFCHLKISRSDNLWHRYVFRSRLSALTTQVWRSRIISQFWAFPVFPLCLLNTY